VLAGQERDDEVLVAVADIWRRTLAVEHLDVDEEFNSLGGNSLLTSHMLREYEKTYPGVMDIADLFAYTTVRQQADYVRVSIAGAAQASAARQEAAAGTETAHGIESDMDAILDMLSRGEMTVEESSARLILERRTDPT
jgi:polyketide synthase PksN